MRPSARWLAPLAVGAVVGGLAAAGPLSAGAAVDVPERTPAEVLVLAQEADVPAFSGTVEVSADLGLPVTVTGTDAGHPEPSIVEGAAGELLGVLSGDTTLRLWVDGPDRLRLQVLADYAETDLVRDGPEAWAYSSRHNTATRLLLPAADGTVLDEPAVSEVTPQELADRVLTAVDASTEVTVGEPVEVVGRAAYELVLAPRAAESLVGQVAVAVDAETGMALRVRVDARGREEPALVAGYTELTLARPAAEVFDFTPPAGATVRDYHLSAGGDGHESTGHEDDPGKHVVGESWARVVVLPGAPPDDPLVDLAFRRVEGGRLLASTLLSVLITDDGRTLLGAVTPEALAAAAAS